VTKADEVVKARLAAQRASDMARKEQTTREEIEARTRYLADDIPRLLALLEERDYPNAILLDVSSPTLRRLFGRQPRSVEMAAWLLDEDRWSEGWSSVHMLSDGRLISSGWGSQAFWNSGPITPKEIPIKYSEEGALNLLRRASKGVKQLIEKYSDR
jgi:hypothetical protein